MSSERFRSITHVHIYAIINTLIKYQYDTSAKRNFRLLDVGCGNGVLLGTLVKELSQRHTDITFEYFGLDVEDSHVQKSGYFEKTIEYLQSVAPEIFWGKNLELITSKDPWPFKEDNFDIIFSNQVLEHVFDQELFLNEVRRTMKPKGYSFHVYPLRHYMFEGHLLMPMAHKHKSWTTTYYWIKWASFLGMGTYRHHKKLGLIHSTREYAELHADYLAYQVNYQTLNQINTTAKHCRLKPSFDFTYLFYKQKIRHLLRLPLLEVYKKSSIRSSRNSFSFIFLKYISAITLVLKKTDSSSNF